MTAKERYKKAGFSLRVQVIQDFDYSVGGPFWEIWIMSFTFGKFNEEAEAWLWVEDNFPLPEPKILTIQDVNDMFLNGIKDTVTLGMRNEIVKPDHLAAQQKAFRENIVLPPDIEAIKKKWQKKQRESTHKEGLGMGWDTPEYNLITEFLSDLQVPSLHSKTSKQGGK